MRILGVDPGLLTTGYGIIEVSEWDPSLVEGGIIHAGSTEDPLETRLSCLYDGVVEILEHFRPQVLALEELYSHYEHPTTAILMGHARGIIYLAAAKSSIPVFSYAATQIKLSLTRNGRATKEQVQRAIQVRLKLKEIPSPADVADALATALCHHSVVSSPVIAATKPSSGKNQKGESI